RAATAKRVDRRHCRRLGQCAAHRSRRTHAAAACATQATPRTLMAELTRETKRQRYNKLFTGLRTERQSFEPHWQEIANFIYPRGVRVTPNDTNKGWKRNQHIVDGTGTRAARTLEAGLMSGMTSPARPWFRLGTMDSELAKFGPVKTWLEQVRVILASRL